MRGIPLKYKWMLHYVHSAIFRRVGFHLYKNYPFLLWMANGFMSYVVVVQIMNKKDYLDKLCAFSWKRYYWICEATKPNIHLISKLVIPYIFVVQNLFQPTSIIQADDRIGYIYWKEIYCELWKWDQRYCLK